MFCGRLEQHTATEDCLKERDDVTVREMLTLSRFCADERKERTQLIERPLKSSCDSECKRPSHLGMGTV